MENLNHQPVRIASIDILRAITMILMIFVNDLWSLTNTPGWLEHVEQGVDGIGLADTVFPAFLFIVGLSIPFSLQNRIAKGDTRWQLVQHVLLRAFALLVLGVFLVNGEELNEAATGLPRHVFNTLCCTSFILIWNSYPKGGNKNWILFAKGAGVVILLILAYMYRGGGSGDGYFSPKWWGILGLIGWAYGASGLVAIFTRNSFVATLSGWIFFCLLSMASSAGLITHTGVLSFIPNPLLSGTLVALTMGGVLISFIFQYYSSRSQIKSLFATFFAISIVWIGLYLITRPYWGLSKLGATPPWLFLCSAFTLLAFIVIYWVADVKGKANWFNALKPAGTDTLLCYFIPYFSYALVGLVGLGWPSVMLTGGIGLIKSFVFALLCAWITGRLNRAGIKLKL